MDYRFPFGDTQSVNVCLAMQVLGTPLQLSLSLRSTYHLTQPYLLTINSVLLRQPLHALLHICMYNSEVARRGRISHSGHLTLNAIYVNPKELVGASSNIKGISWEFAEESIFLDLWQLTLLCVRAWEDLVAPCVEQL